MKKKEALIVLFILLITGWFYWFQWRPSEIRKECVPSGFGTTHNGDEKNLLAYELCIHRHGLE